MNDSHPPRTMAELLQVRADSHAHHAALTSDSDGLFARMDYKTLYRASVSLSIWIRRLLTVNPGERVLLFSESCPEWVVADAAISMSGGCTVPIHRGTTASQLVDVFHQTHPILAIISERNSRVIDEALSYSGASIPAIRLDSIAEAIKSTPFDEAAIAPEAFDPEHICSILYTSGTTVEPRGVPLRHRNLFANAHSFLRRLHLSSDDRLFSVLQLSHVYERVTGLIAPLMAGASIHYPAQDQSVMDRMFSVNPTVVMAVPRIAEKALAYAETSAEKFGNLHTMVVGGAALNAETAKRIAALGTRVLQGYGLTETACAVAMNPPHDSRPGFVGPPIDIVETRVNDEGVLEVRGPNVADGYLDHHDPTVFKPDGWFCTGDVVELSDDGYLKIIDRKRDFIALSTGEKVAPRPIEDLLEHCSLIHQAMIVGEGRKHIVALITVENPKILFQAGFLTRLEAEIANAVGHLAPNQQVKAYVVFSHPFSEELGEITATGKLRRAYIQEKYSTDIDHAYRTNWLL